MRGRTGTSHPGGPCSTPHSARPDAERPRKAKGAIWSDDSPALRTPTEIRDAARHARRYRGKEEPFAGLYDRRSGRLTGGPATLRSCSTRDPRPTPVKTGARAGGLWGSSEQHPRRSSNPGPATGKFVRIEKRTHPAPGFGDAVSSCSATYRAGAHFGIPPPPCAIVPGSSPSRTIPLHIRLPHTKKRPRAPGTGRSSPAEIG